MCNHCARLPFNRIFIQKVILKHDAVCDAVGVPHAFTPNCTMSHAQKDAKLAFLAGEIKKSKQRERRHRKFRGVHAVKSAFERKDIRKFVMELNFIAKKGSLETRKVMWSYLQDVIKAEYLKVRSDKNKYSKGMRWSQDTKDLFSSQKIMGGKQINRSQRENVGGPSLKTVHRHTRKFLLPMNSGLKKCCDNFCELAKIWKPFIEARHISHPKEANDVIPCEMSEDETGIIARLSYCETTDTIIGSCGWRSRNHKCDPDFCPAVGDNWDHLVKIMRECVPSTYARVIMVNPCVQWLKPVAVYANPTCNKFNHYGHPGDVVKQWSLTLKLFDDYLTPLGLHFVGRGSDGDARRYLLQHATMKANAFRLRQLTLAAQKMQKVWRLHRRPRPPGTYHASPTPVSAFTGCLPVSLQSLTSAASAPGFTFAALGIICVLINCT